MATLSYVALCRLGKSREQSPSMGDGFELESALEEKACHIHHQGGGLGASTCAH